MVGVTRFILRHPRAVLAAAIVLVGLGVWQRTRLEESQSLQALIVRGDPRREIFERMQRDFGDDEVLAIAVDADAVYRPEVLATIDALSRWLSGLDAVGRVTSLTSVERLEVASVLGVPGACGGRRCTSPVGANPKPYGCAITSARTRCTRSGWSAPTSGRRSLSSSSRSATANASTR